EVLTRSRGHPGLCRGASGGVMLRSMLLAATALVAAGAAPARTGPVPARPPIDPPQGGRLAGPIGTGGGGPRAAAGPRAARAAGKLVDWSAYTVLPGLLDCHTHIADGYAEGDPIAPLRSTQAESVLRGVATAKVELDSGFTSVRDVGVYRGLTDVALRDAI